MTREVFSRKQCDSSLPSLSQRDQLKGRRDLGTASDLRKTVETAYNATKLQMLTSSHSVKVVHFKKNSEEITSVGIILRREKNYELGKNREEDKSIENREGLDTGWISSRDFCKQFRDKQVGKRENAP